MEHAYGLLENGASASTLRAGYGEPPAHHGHCQQRTLDLEEHAEGILDHCGFDVVPSRQGNGRDDLRNAIHGQIPQWTSSSRTPACRATERDGYAWFCDAVRIVWTDTETGIRYSFDSRWIGTLEERGGWLFVGMHVSGPREL